MHKRIWATAALLWLATGGLAVAQQNQPINLPTRGPSMPGQVVGSSLPAAGVGPVGNRLPPAAPMAGSPVGRPPGGLPPQLDPNFPKPPGMPINMQNVVGPYPNMADKNEPNFWDSLYSRWAMLFGSNEPAKRPPNFTPGLVRRNRERNNDFRRD